MADSDEEYDRRRARDKFRRERSDYQERRDDRGRREDFPERESWNNRERGGRREYRDYDPRGRRDRYSPPPPRHDISPPMKRVRMDWNDDIGSGYMGGGYDMGYPGGRGGGNMMGGPPGSWGGRGGMHPDIMHGNDMDPGITQPPMKTFKQFLSEQNDNIDDQEAVKCYNDYKQDFKRQQLSEFFIIHKEEEWFKSKYHPEEFERRKEEQQESINKRLNVFMELFQGQWLDNVSVDADKSDQIIRVLDAVVIKLEGGTDHDLRSLDEPPEEPQKESELIFKIVKDEKAAPTESAKDEDDKDAKGDDSKKDEEEEDKDKDSVDEDTPKKKKKKAKSRNKNDDESSDSDSNSSSGSSDSEDSSSLDDDDEDEKSKKDAKEKEKRKRKKSKKKESDVEEGETTKSDNKTSSNDNLKDSSDTKEEGEMTAEPENVASPDKENEDNEEEKADKPPSKSEPSKPCPLHRTCSIFLRNLPPTITKQEVEAMFKKFDGFLRVAIADPSPERRFFRRGWVTYERTVNVKRICFEVSEIKLRDCDLGAIVNRDLIRRIRPVNGITSHKQVARSDIKIAVKIIQNLDNQRNLWKDLKAEASSSFKTKNPLLENISDYLIEEASAEEEELLGISIDEGGQPNTSGDSVATLERDETLIKVLDRLLLYLRVVHSIDYYNYSDYPNEDEMPNRCGIMHARGPPPKDAVTQQEIDEYQSFFDGKIAPILNPITKVPKEEAVKLGLKEPQAEVEKFVKANSQEVGTGKWLCPLSGKKFKGPEFVRKHIFNKHHEKITEVETEAAYFNNYLLDPKRPSLPEHPFNRHQNNMMAGPPGHMGPRDMPGGPGFMGAPGFMGPPFGGNYGHRGPMPMFGGASGFGGRNAYQDMHSRGGGNFGKLPGHGNVNKPRKMISYNDLDEPKEQDFF